MMLTPQEVADQLVRDAHKSTPGEQDPDKGMPRFSCGLFAEGKGGAAEVWWPGYVRQPLADEVRWEIPADAAQLHGPVCSPGPGGHYHPSHVAVFDRDGNVRCTGPAVPLKPGGGLMGFIVALSRLAAPGCTVVGRPPRPEN